MKKIKFSKVILVLALFISSPTAVLLYNKSTLSKATPDNIVYSKDRDQTSFETSQKDGDDENSVPVNDEDKKNKTLRLGSWNIGSSDTARSSTDLEKKVNKEISDMYDQKPAIFKKTKKGKKPSLAQYVAFQVVSNGISGVAIQEVGKKGFKELEKAFKPYGWKGILGQKKPGGKNVTEHCPIFYDPAILTRKANSEENTFNETTKKLKNQLDKQIGAFNLVAFRVVDNKQDRFTFNFMCRHLPQNKIDQKKQINLQLIDLDMIQELNKTLKLATKNKNKDVSPFTTFKKKILFVRPEQNWRQERRPVIGFGPTINGDLIVAGDFNNTLDKDPLKTFIDKGEWGASKYKDGVKTAKTGPIDYFLWNSSAEQDQVNLEAGTIRSGVINSGPNNPPIYPVRKDKKILAIDHVLIWKEFHRTGHDTD